MSFYTILLAQLNNSWLMIGGDNCSKTPPKVKNLTIHERLLKCVGSTLVASVLVGFIPRIVWLSIDGCFALLKMIDEVRNYGGQMVMPINFSLDFTLYTF